MSRFIAFLVALFVLVLAACPAWAADFPVGTGTAASCTETAFDTALASVQNSGGGTLTFNCGGAATINFTAGKVISAPTVTIAGGGKITLNGANAVRHFYVEADANLTVKDIVLTNGFDNTYGGGSILSLGELTLNNATIRNSSVTSEYSGGGIMAYKPVTITNSLIENNTGGSVGGLFLFGEAADATIAGSTFRNNRTTSTTYGLGGALTTWDGADVTIRSSTFEQNQARFGGAIYNKSNNTIIAIEQNSILHDNSAMFNGGGIHNVAGDIRLSQVTLSNNTTAEYGGGLYVYPGTAQLRQVTLSNNVAEYGGAFAIADGTAELSQVTLSGNRATHSGGAIQVYRSTLSLANVTVSGNSATVAGGGFESTFGDLSLTYVTFSANSAGGASYQAAALSHGDLGQFGAGVTVKNVIFQGSPGAGPNCYISMNSKFISLGFNLSSDDTCPLNQAGDHNNADAMLGPLADNGGPMLTHMPLSGSPAIDAGQCTPNLTADQRGLPRSQGLACDIGAVERQPDEGDSQTFLPLLSR